VAEKFLEDDGFVVLFVFCAVYECGWPFGYGLFQQGDLSWILVEFGMVARLELWPFFWVVGEPFSEFVAWGDLFEPEVYVGFFFVRPRGQSRSTRMRVPSSSDGSS
jgi:hypothetical protein